MEETVFVKCEPAWSSDTEEHSSFENFQPGSEMIPPKQETTSELTEPRPTQGNAFKPSEDIKEEMFIEQNQPLPNIKEENKMEKISLMAIHTANRAKSCTMHSVFSQEPDLPKHMVSSSGQNTHIRSDVGPYRCEECNKSYKKKEYLRIHKFTHTGERRYQCHHCAKAFTRRTSLKDHISIHSGERLHQCKECSKTFNKKGNLRNHMFTHTGERKYFCVECSKTFKTKGHLQDHLNIHTGVRPFRCQYCTKAFTQRGSLKDHINTHTGEKPYQCQNCRKAFTHRGSLNAHMVTHTVKGR